jgi:hypothetical protein
MLVCASIITQPIESQGNLKILLKVMQGNYAGFAQSERTTDIGWER